LIAVGRRRSRKEVRRKRSSISKEEEAEEEGGNIYGDGVMWEGRGLVHCDRLPK
jgi:hypothetical protein